MMEGERKKRRIANEEEEEEDEEVKMERFFALIRSAKDIRDQLLEVEKRRQRDAAKPPQVPPPAVKTPAAEAQYEVKNCGWQPKDSTAEKELFTADLDLINQLAGSSRRSEEENQRADHNNNSNSKNNKNHFQSGRRSGIAIDLNLFPVSVTDLDTADFTM